jgi:hypothetical protein
MSNLTKNYKLQKPLEDDFYDINITNSNMDIIDKGLTLDVGTSKGTGNNYILDIGSITLAESNKGVSFKFFADKDSTGAVTINTNYNLIKANKNPVKNLKSGAPYIITYDGGSNFFLASGADDSDSTSVGTDGSNVKTGITFVGTDGEIHTGVYTADGTITADKVLSGYVGYSKAQKIIGTMVNRGAPISALNCGGTYNLAEGYYTGGKVTANSLASQTPANADASTIIAGRNAWVNGNLINGIATIGSLGGKKYATGTCSGGSTVNVGFRPEFVFLSGTYANKEAFACITPQNDTDGYPIYHDTTQSTYERWIKQTNNSKVSVTDTGFIVGFSTVSAWTYFCIG